MPTLKLNSKGKLILKNGKASCVCCLKLIIEYTWIFSGDPTAVRVTTATALTGFNPIGFWCGTTANDYSSMSLRGGGMEVTEIATIDLTKSHGVIWTSSLNINCGITFHGFYDDVEKPGIIFRVTCMGHTKTAYNMQYNEDKSVCNTNNGFTVIVDKDIFNDETAFTIN